MPLTGQCSMVPVVVRSNPGRRAATACSHPLALRLFFVAPIPGSKTTFYHCSTVPFITASSLVAHRERAVPGGVLS